MLEGMQEAFDAAVAQQEPEAVVDAPAPEATETVQDTAPAESQQPVESTPQTPLAQQTAKIDWDSPENPWKKRHADSSRENNRIRAMQRVVAPKLTVQQTAAKKAKFEPNEENNFCGAGSVAQWNWLIENDKGQAQDMYQAAWLAANPQILDQRIEQKLAERFAPLQEEQIATHRGMMGEECWQKYPEGKSGPLNAAAKAWFEQNFDFTDTEFNPLDAVERAMPGVNLTEVAFVMSHYPILRQELAAARAGKVQAGKRAGVATSTGGSGVSLNDTPENMESNLGNELRRNGSTQSSQGFAESLRHSSLGKKLFGKK